jgi:hypothetical protein
MSKYTQLLRSGSVFGGALVALALAACGGTAAQSQQSVTATVAPVTPSATPTPVSVLSTATPAPVAATNPLTSWCQLSIGESKTAALVAMPTPSGHQADQYKSLLGPGMSNVEWDTSGDILLATFDATGRAVNLQAYAGSIGPAGASNISCPAFRV